ncbi:K(+) efflux antiporter 2, chloroplastic isoform X2 [Physcomitrium patens]|uniref:RCK N-terminal domain-containing protein n=1 Tax=Physcomitrium patens TaxID=3218 RepID=A0A7I4A804_PHYPA
MAWLGMVDVPHVSSHVPPSPVLKPEFRSRCSAGQVPASSNAASFLQNLPRALHLTNSERSRFRGTKTRDSEVTASLKCCTSCQNRCGTLGNRCIARRGRINYDRVIPRVEGLGRGDPSSWPLSGQCCILSSFSKQLPSSRRHSKPRVRGNFEVRCESDHAAANGFIRDAILYDEAGVALGEGGVDGAGAESMSQISLENSLLGSNVDDGNRRPQINEGDDGRSPVAENDSPIAALKDSLRIAKDQLEFARASSKTLEAKAQECAEKALALHDQATSARLAAVSTLASIQSVLERELKAEENVAAAGARVLAAQEKFTRAEKAFQVARWKLEPPGTSLDDLSLEIPEEYLQLQVEPTNDEVNDQASSASSEAELLENSKLVSCEGDEKKPREGNNKGKSVRETDARKEYLAMESARMDFVASEAALAECEAELAQIQTVKMELQKEALRRSELSQVAEDAAVLADEDVASAMTSAEEAVALEMEALKRVSDAEIVLRKVEAFAEEAARALTKTEASGEEVFKTHQNAETSGEEASQTPELAAAGTEQLDFQVAQANDETSVTSESWISVEEEKIAPEKSGEEMGDTDAGTDFLKRENAMESSIESEKLDKEPQPDQMLVDVNPKHEEPKSSPTKRAESTTNESSGPKSLTKKSSRFFPASYFSSGDEAEFSPSMVFSNFAAALKEQLVKVTIGMALLIAGGYYLNNQLEKRALLMQPPEVTSTQELKTTTKPLVSEIRKISRRVKQVILKLPHQEVNEDEASLFDVLWLLLASVVFVPIFQRLPGGSPVLGYLAAGVLIGPYALSIIKNIHGTRMIAEFGVVFLLFNIGLELSVERLTSMKKYVFGFGSIQVLVTALVIGAFAHVACGFSGPAAIVIGNGLALSSTAVVLQVLQERGENTSRHGRATFSVLLFQDLAVVVLLILIPLLSPNSSKGGVGIQAIAEALGIAAVKAVVAITGIIAGGRLLLRPVYKRMAENHNAEIFAANTLLVVLGTSVMTARAGLSMALGAFLAGLLLAETEFALQVESDIAPYRGLLLGLFFMTVGMSIDSQLFINRFPTILGSLMLLIGGKTLLVTGVGRFFGLSTVAAARAGLLLAPGGEFAFVAFGEAVNQGIMSNQLSSLLFLVVGLSMAITPWLAAGGQLLASRFDQQDVRSLLPAESETDDLQGHILICGFGRVGQIIAQLLSERLIPFVALDVRSERVSVGRALDLPVYFGDAGSKEVLHKVGAERAAAAVLTLDTPGANYRTVFALTKNFPHVKTFVRAHDVEHGLNLEKAGATAVVPETLEPSLQLAAAVLSQVKLPAAEIAAAIDEFRSNHLSELSELSETRGTSLGYGFSRIMMKSKIQPPEVQTRLGIDDGVSDWRPEGSVLP